MKNIKLIASLFLIVIVAGTVSAFWPFDGGITGNAVVTDNTVINDSAYSNCADTDGGIYSNTSGVVSYKTRTYKDKCSKNDLFVHEYYCNSKGKVKKKAFACENGCEEDTTLGAKCLDAPVCTQTVNGSIDTFGKEHKNKCSGGNWIIHTCDTTTNKVVETTEECSTRCSNSARGCTGTCVEISDVDNSIYEPGQITIDGVSQFDTCIRNAVKQYGCENGTVKNIRPKQCGLNKICRNDGAGAYCDNITTTSTSTSLEIKDGTASIHLESTSPGMLLGPRVIFSQSDALLGAIGAFTVEGTGDAIGTQVGARWPLVLYEKIIQIGTTDSKANINGEVVLLNLTGSGNAYACLNEEGKLFRSTSPCSA